MPPVVAIGLCRWSGGPALWAPPRAAGQPPAHCPQAVGRLPGSEVGHPSHPTPSSYITMRLRWQFCNHAALHGMTMKSSRRGGGTQPSPPCRVPNDAMSAGCPPAIEHHPGVLLQVGWLGDTPRRCRECIPVSLPPVKAHPQFIGCTSVTGVWWWLRQGAELRRICPGETLGRQPRLSCRGPPEETLWTPSGPALTSSITRPAVPHRLSSQNNVATTAAPVSMHTTLLIGIPGFWAFSCKS